MVRSCFVGPGNGPETPSLQQAKRQTRGGGRENRTRVKPATRVFRPTPIAPKAQNPRPHPRRPGTGPTSAPTSAARPLHRSQTNIFRPRQRKLVVVSCSCIKTTHKIPGRSERCPRLFAPLPSIRSPAAGSQKGRWETISGVSKDRWQIISGVCNGRCSKKR